MYETNKTNGALVIELGINNNGFDFSSNILSAIDSANLELQELDDELGESIDTIKKLTPECDKTDYI